MYIITDYIKLYNPTDSKGGKLVNAKYVKMPIKPRGKGLRALLRKDEGLSILGVWTLLLQAATESTKPELRGMLLDHKDEPASIEDIADSISLSSREDFVKTAIETLISMKWMSSVPDTELLRSHSVPNAELLPPKVKVKVREVEISKTKVKEPLDFTATGSFNFKKLFTETFRPKTTYEKNTLNKLAKDYAEHTKGLKNAGKYIIDKIEDLTLMCRTQNKSRTDAIRIFVSQVKKEMK